MSAAQLPVDCACFFTCDKGECTPPISPLMWAGEPRRYRVINLRGYERVCRPPLESEFDDSDILRKCTLCAQLPDVASAAGSAFDAVRTNAAAPDCRSCIDPPDESFLLTTIASAAIEDTSAAFLDGHSLRSRSMALRTKAGTLLARSA